MRRGVLKSKSSYGKFAKSEEYAKWAIKKKQMLKKKALFEVEYIGKNGKKK